MEMKNQSELWGAGGCGWLRPQQGTGQDGEERLLPQPAQTRRWLGKAKHHQLISFYLANIPGVFPKPAPKQINKAANPSEFPC